MIARSSIACITLLCCISAGCAGLSETEQTRFDVHMDNAQKYYDSGSYVQAEQQTAKALAVDPDDEKARLLYGWAILQQDTPAKLREAEEIFSSLARSAGDDFRVRLGLGTARQKLALVRSRQADVLEKRGDTELLEQARKDYTMYLASAEKEYEKTLELNPDYPEALSNLGQIKALNGESEEAIELLERFLTLAEQTRRYLEGEKRKRILTDDQLVILNNKISRNIKREVTVRDLVANIHYDNDRVDEAISQLDRILALDPTWTDTYLQRAQCYDQVGEHEKALTDIRTFLRKTDRDFEDPMVQTANRLLKEYVTKR